ncbi:hypothetical protein NAT51_19125 [Flavobacterium amniphilum]|uniref:hypothetical protein n=1 Tax=Flavobacterium amniphilum TaxID=1834035 RepID=UPI00202AA83D|nr:hypothetical protein [Flavobacterium amniphilum]MCL9807643.1 hypothetical protein [Flavobacterium amniphilum]
MKQLISAFAVLLFTAHAFGQSEFKTYSNNLIYSVKTMKKLEHIVDSLNLKYKVCDYNKVFHSKYQTIGHFIELDTGDVKQAKKDMENNIPFDDFVRKYPNAGVRKNILVVKYQYKDHKKRDMAEFSEISLNGGYGIEITQENKDNAYSKPSKNTWKFEYNEKSKYSKESAIAFYFPDEFKSVSLDMKYNRQIGYSDCLIDTVATKYKEHLEQGWVELPKNWQDLSDKKKEKLLDEMRSTRVIGGCSMDSRPREHAMNIALLSAETTNWGVFLKSHLDIMNDRFERVSDGSYAFGQRKTYIKELEELDINVQDLLIGISLRVENPAENHYYGSIGRLGRAISESEHKEAFKKQILSMIEDQQLDDYNRVLAYYLFLNFNSYLDNEKEQKENTALLEKAVQTMPVYLSEKIKLKEG